MNDQEIKILCQMARNGNKKAEDKIIKANMGLVHKFARKIWNNNPKVEYQDVVQEGMIGVYLAIQKTTLDDTNKFSTYASIRIKARVIRFLRQNFSNIKVSDHLFNNLDKEENKENRDVIESCKAMMRLDVQAKNSDENSSTLHETLACDKIAFECPDQAKLTGDIEDFYSFLNEEEQLLMKSGMGYMGGVATDDPKRTTLTKKEISGKLGVSVATVSKRMRKVETSMGQYLESCGWETENAGI